MAIHRGSLSFLGSCPSCYLNILDKPPKQVCSSVGPTLAASVELMTYRGNVASLSLFYRYYFSIYSSELTELVPLPLSRGRSTCCSDRLHDFSVSITRGSKDGYVNSFLSRKVRTWNSLLAEFLPLAYDLYSFEGVLSGLRQFWQRKPFKIEEKCFLLHLKSSFRSQNIKNFVFIFWSYTKTT